MADKRDMTLEKAIRIVVEAMEDKKAEEINILEIGAVSSVADYFVIAGGSNDHQVKAIADAVEEKLGKAGYVPKGIEGYQNANWILMDYGDFVLHIFDRENRDYYRLERIWKDAKVVDKQQFLNAE